jgi:hypothetical protein
MSNFPSTYLVCINNECFYNVLCIGMKNMLTSRDITTDLWDVRDSSLSR